ncbi:hypothetical protein [Methylobacterium soli]|uniref:Uncharacterized protein n=1 Tax=Methylobacterium soli TaxID=553447 RepID=A0A6L3STI0_9HYPH|nr:hypothetical protein [Methylobacterium soli]KAB1076462.1 hypothetical protein F6X53_23380 [Methylobacterium soli]GJE44677.1 hypothetical protein AEGHOMDF_3867 [Methylobacterium soli]
MAGFIVIERDSSRVYGDTARLGSGGDVIPPADADCFLDRRSGCAARGFGHVSPKSDAASYDVYEVPPSHAAGAR